METQGHRRPTSSADYLRWALGFALAGLVSYFTALNAINSQIAEIRAKQDSQFGEVLRRLDVMQADIRELRHAR